MDNLTNYSFGVNSATFGGNLTIQEHTFSITGAPAADGLFYFYAAQGTNQADRWLIKADKAHELLIQNYTSGAWVELLGLTSAGLLSINSTIGVDSILDQDDFYSDSDTALATQQSIKAYVDGVSWQANIDHGSIAGLGDDDHTQYLLVDGTRTMTNELLISSINPRVKFTDTNASDPNDWCVIGKGSDQFYIVMWDDSASQFQNLLIVNIDGTIDSSSLILKDVFFFF